MIKNDVGRFKLIAVLEGLSLLILLFIAMPLKYWFDSPMMVKIVGYAHGILFIAFSYYTLLFMIRYKWSIIKAGLVFLSSFVPFGTFIFEAKVLKKM